MAQVDGVKQGFIATVSLSWGASAAKAMEDRCNWATCIQSPRRARGNPLHLGYGGRIFGGRLDLSVLGIILGFSRFP